ncbi:hypothetical protein CVT25_006071 [Psilocybe cyanescens]|uniref:Uncharacterized protein n=1 Tax=Psilocybe cyanescens TaxID=93625 RepID=A0A409VMP6_PSICY|nr:hypothetical protein CVT25_006071 [Psilocybe cyanescens]
MMNTNAVAGPSSMPSLIPHYSSSPSPPPPTHQYPRPPTPPLLFLPPPPGYSFPSLSIILATDILTAIPSHTTHHTLPLTVRTQPKQHLASTQDLLARFHLHPAYDKYVRPLVTPGDDSMSASIHDQPTNAVDGATDRLDKGKGRERDPATAGTPGPSGVAEADQADGGDGDDDDAPGGKGEKKKKNTYKHLIKGVPGKHSLKKDDWLTSMMLVPPKQRMRISQFDLKTQEDAFTVSSDGLKGWNINTLVVESAQAREDRKKRVRYLFSSFVQSIIATVSSQTPFFSLLVHQKEARRLAKLQQAQAQANGVASHPDSATGASTPLPFVATPAVSTPVVAHPQPVKGSVQAGAGARRMVVPGRMGTPRTGAGAVGVGTPRPVSAAPPPSTVAIPSPVFAAQASGEGGGANGPTMITTSTSTVPRPGSAVPRPGSAVPRPGTVPMKQQQGQGQPPLRTGTPMDVDQQRGKKRERDEGVSINGNVNGNGAHVNGHGHGMVNGGGGGVQQYQGAMAHPNHGAVNSKAGTGNIRPRPIKKQRMDMQGQARDVNGPVQQQPTPQGV